jgi:2'-5' RNA ligase
MEKLRLFLAIDIDEALKEKISLIKKNLEEVCPFIKWTKPDTWHLTLKFLGETKKDKLKNIIKVCSDTFPNYGSFEITLKDISAFPNLRMPRVIFIDTIIPQTLHSIYEDIEDKLSELGFKKEDRKFHPHITLARIKDVKPFLKQREQITEKFNQIGKEISFNLNVKEIVLYQSILTPKGPTYIKIDSFKLLS